MGGPVSKNRPGVIEEIIVRPRHGHGDDGAARGQLRMVQKLTPQIEELFDDFRRPNCPALTP